MSNALLRLITLAAVAVLIGIAAGAWLMKPATHELRSGTLLTTPRAIDAFQLANADGQAFTKADFTGHWTVLFAGYTYCPDVCPTTLAELKAVQTKLGAPDSVRFVFLSVDPARDTPTKLAQYVHYFSPTFVGVTGDDAALEKLGANLGYVYAKVPGATPESYLMDHSAALILIGPDASVHGYFTPPFKADALAADLRSLIAG